MLQATLVACSIPLPTPVPEAPAPTPPLRTYGDPHHPWSPPATLAAWQHQAHTIRSRVLVAAGLWPPPPRTPLTPTITHRVERDDYTVEQVTLQSRPGHYVTGNLYRPRHATTPTAAVLSPHGHWSRGRLQDAGLEAANQQIAAGAEGFVNAARHPLQARAVQLARMGCVVFHYDMVGYGSSTALQHHQGFDDAAALLELQNMLALQTWNSIRALDFVASLPDVDPERIGVTGASGGGTQTFLLCAVDERPRAAFPAVMVSTAMQGGCVCENAPLLRLDANNVALAALCAPRPLAMTGANDWTRDIETRGLPELRAVYSLFGATDHVAARCFPEFGHNYNAPARAVMYAWFREHLGLGDVAIEERDFEPLGADDLTIPEPADALALDALRASWSAEIHAAWQAELAAARDDPGAFRELLERAGTALLAGGEDEDARLAVRSERPTTARGHVIWVRGPGVAQDLDPDELLGALLDAGIAVHRIDLPPLEPWPAGTDLRYALAYNRTPLARQVAAVRAAIEGLGGRGAPTLLATHGAGPAAVLANATRPVPSAILADIDGFAFADIERADDPMLLPGALRYGGLGGLGALTLPARVEIFGVHGSAVDELGALTAARAAFGGQVALHARSMALEDVAGSFVNPR